MLLIQILIATTIASLAGLLGGVLLIARPRKAQRLAHILVSFAAGSIIAAAFLDLLPEAIEAVDPRHAFLLALAGFFLFFCIEKLLLWYHCPAPAEHWESQEDATVAPRLHAHEHASVRATVPLLVASDTIHNFLDGVAIAAAFALAPVTGIVTALAVLIHEIPHEVGDFSIFLARGVSRRRTLLINVGSALAALLGALIAYSTVASIADAVAPIAAFIAGGFLYIGAADLIPEIHRDLNRRHIALHVLLFLLGVAVIMAVGLLE